MMMVLRERKVSIVLRKGKYNKMNKRKILLSFRPEFFRPLLYNIKKYEYRKRFCEEPTTAYLYLSSPVKEIVGIVEFGTPLKLEEELKKYNLDTFIRRRIKGFIDKKIKYAIPIESLKLYKEPISLHKLKEIDPKFTAPQCYLNIENKKKIMEYLVIQDMYDYEFENKHDIVFESNLCVSCTEMEVTDEFLNKDREYIDNPKYFKIKPVYINKRR